MNKKIMVAMSGGVDSSVAAALLLKDGNYVSGATLRLFEPDGKPTAEALRAAEICRTLGIEHLMYDKRELFRQKIINGFSEQYNKGLTPNPCIECNKHIKFGALLDEAISSGFDFIATGHYSKVKQHSDARFYIVRPQDIKKDQTYVLWQLNQYQLSHILMPLGDYTKDTVREIAAEYGFSSAHAKDSQDICFVPDGDYAGFLEKYCKTVFEPGDYVDINGNYLGKHSGHQHYTVGQRKGLGIALGKPQFVISKSCENNTVVLSDEEYLFKKRVYITDTNFSFTDRLTQPLCCTGKLRYSAKDMPCRVEPISKNDAVIEFETPQRAPSPGQSAVFYDGELLLGGGIITKEQ